MMNQSTGVVPGPLENIRSGLALLFHLAALPTPHPFPGCVMQLALSSPRTHPNAEWACFLPLQQLSSTLLHPCNAGKEPCNQNKNRYKSIIPCKQSSPGLAQALGAGWGSTGCLAGVGAPPALQKC